jgi:hypothetical protein
MMGLRDARCASQVGDIQQVTAFCERDADCAEVRQEACFRQPNCRVKVKCGRSAFVEEQLKSAAPPWVKVCEIIQP